MSLQRALLVLIVLSLLAGLVPAAVILDRRLAGSLEDRTREDLAVAPRLLDDREAMTADAMAMHAKDLAGAEGLAQALARGDRSVTTRLARQAQEAYGEQAVLVDREGEAWLGPAPAPELLAAARSGRVGSQLIRDGDVLRRVALAPVMSQGDWLGAAGVSTMIDETTAGALAGLTRSEVILVFDDGTVAAATGDDELSVAVSDERARLCGDGGVHDLQLDAGPRYVTVCAPLPGPGRVVFARNLDRELAVLPELRRVAALAGLSALVLAVLLGSFLAVVLARPVRALAGAADRLAAGDFEAPVPRSSVREVERVAQAFVSMRRALAERLAELEAANRELAERQRRLSALQAELIQRDRLAASGRLVTELAHEIRNPVANVRNCLEVISRRVGEEGPVREFTDLAIDELLRMHELAERMLDINRPRDPSDRGCDAAAVAREVATLVRAGAAESPLEIEVTGRAEATAAIPADALKQVLLNLIQNAREALNDDGWIELAVEGGERGVVVLEVKDDGPGIPDDVLPRVFDPFFTTKGSVQGVGLGLFVAEGIVRSYGGTVSAANRGDAGGASFRIELPAAEAAAPPRAGATEGGSADEGGG